MQRWFSFYQQPQIFFGSLELDDDFNDLDFEWNIDFDFPRTNQTGLFFHWPSNLD